MSEKSTETQIKTIVEQLEERFPRFCSALMTALKTKCTGLLTELRIQDDKDDKTISYIKNTACSYLKDDKYQLLLDHLQDLQLYFQANGNIDNTNVSVSSSVKMVKKKQLALRTPGIPFSKNVKVEKDDFNKKMEEVKRKKRIAEDDISELQIKLQKAEFILKNLKNEEAKLIEKEGREDNSILISDDEGDSINDDDSFKNISTHRSSTAIFF